MPLEQAASWRPHLEPEFDKPYMQELRSFLAQRKAQKVRIYPHSQNWFRALELTPLDQVKVVILGQDPYHQPGQAQGLSFSVPTGTKIPPSLRNIMAEIQTDLGIPPASHGSLESWAQQGVLLLNAVLTVEDSSANAHQGKGWEQFTDQIVQLVNDQVPQAVFMLWGSYAQKKGAKLDAGRHLILKAPHPSPLSAHRGFLGCKHFSQANSWLRSHNSPEIDWSLPTIA